MFSLFISDSAATEGLLRYTPPQTLCAPSHVHEDASAPWRLCVVLSRCRQESRRVGGGSTFFSHKDGAYLPARIRSVVRVPRGSWGFDRLIEIISRAVGRHKTV